MRHVATVLTVYGIETLMLEQKNRKQLVATVLTVYGIETLCKQGLVPSYMPLQQYLPFTVLKRYILVSSFVK